MDENSLSREIIGAAIEVHRQLGPGLLELIYEEALAFELLQSGLKVSRQAEVALLYKGRTLQNMLRLDMLVNDLVVVELKAVERLLDIHQAQLLSYLRLADKRLGLLINFNAVTLKHAIRRVVNGL